MELSEADVPVGDTLLIFVLFSERKSYLARG